MQPFVAVTLKEIASVVRNCELLIGHLRSLWLRRLGFLCNNSNCTARDADQSLLIIANFDVPYIGAASLVQGNRRCRDKSARGGTDVVRIDFQPYRRLPFPIDQRPGA